MSFSCFSPYPPEKIKANQGEMSKREKYVEKFEQRIRNSKVKSKNSKSSVKVFPLPANQKHN
jgi:hypothetical protein